MSKEEWDGIFPGKQEFENLFGKIIKGSVSYKGGNKIESYIYWDNKEDCQKQVLFENGVIKHG